MNILSKFTIKDLKLNRKRSVVTIVSIMLSTALICAIATMFYSLMNTVTDTYIQSDGLYHAVVSDVNKEYQDYVNNNKKVKNTFAYRFRGRYSSSEFNNVNVLELDKQAFENLNVNVIEGRLPTNSNEIVVEEYFIKYGKHYSVGDKISAEFFTKEAVETMDNIKFSDEEILIETEYETFNKEYTIVGIVKSYGMLLDSEFYGMTQLLSYIDNYDESYQLGIVFKNIRDTVKEMPKIKKNYAFMYNDDLLRWNGVLKKDSSQEALYVIVGIVISIVVICSVFFIRNSFAISITEKKKEIGMLSSIGATKHQIRKMIIKEGLFLSIIGIPLGILCGIFAAYCLCIFSNKTIGSIEEDVLQFKLFIPWIVIIITVIGALITVLLSCLVSAFKAGRISAIEAIRSNDEIKIKRRKIKTSWLTKKLFGIGGVIAAKSLKRSKKKYRTTVISLVVSITIFISLSYFVISFKGVFSDLYKMYNYNGVIYLDDSYNADEMVKDMNDSGLVERIHKYYGSYLPTLANGEEGRDAVINFYEEDEYEAYLKDVKVKKEEIAGKLIYIYDESNKKTKKDEVTFMVPTGSLDAGIIYENKKYELVNVTIGPEGAMGGILYYIAPMSMLDELKGSFGNEIAFKATDVKKLEDYLNKKGYTKITVENIEEVFEMVNTIITWVSVFLYGFIIVIILIGVTNVFNTITTNMSLRSKEFAMLKSVGMTKKEFRRMIRLESIIYGVKSLTIGIILALLSCYGIFDIMRAGEFIDKKAVFEVPFGPIIISIIFIMIVVSMTMKYSMYKINKQNIIETIRKDNI